MMMYHEGLLLLSYLNLQYTNYSRVVSPWETGSFSRVTQMERRVAPYGIWSPRLISTQGKAGHAAWVGIMVFLPDSWSEFLGNRVHTCPCVELQVSLDYISAVYSS